MNGILIIAHAPLASALRLGLLHVFPDAAACVQALDVPANEAPETTLQHARGLQADLHTTCTLVLADVFGATPCNVASQLVDGVHSRLLTGVNLPMLLRAVSYRHEPLEELVARAMLGGTQGVMSVAATPPHNQNQNHRHRSSRDQNHSHHQQ